MTRPRFVLLALGVSACSADRIDVVPIAPAFDFQLSGEQQRPWSGRAFAGPTIQEGAFDLDPASDTLVPRPRTPLLFYPPGLVADAMLTIDIIGDLARGTYPADVPARPAGPRFISTYSVNLGNGLAREYLLSGGTVTITEVNGSSVRGTVSIRFGSYVDPPAPGSSTRPPPVATSLTIFGTFTATWISGPPAGTCCRMMSAPAIR